MLIVAARQMPSVLLTDRIQRDLPQAAYNDCSGSSWRLASMAVVFWGVSDSSVPITNVFAKSSRAWSGFGDWKIFFFFFFFFF
jgi:hypothetical protein